VHPEGQVARLSLLDPARVLQQQLRHRALLPDPPGDRISLTIKRDSQHLTVQVTLGELPGS
jgi:S1-C subfamily serine protease